MFLNLGDTICTELWSTLNSISFTTLSYSQTDWNVKCHIVSFQVTVHRVVNIVDKWSPMPRPGIESDRGFKDDQWYGGPRNYQDTRECHGEGSYQPSDRRYFDENPNFGNFRRNSSPPRNVRQDCYICL